ncbi:hypothetical protein [Labedaea rhizosphaerae]|uniref:Uncharacterized protein n=1 Tax=Labedaea rhizosphaerae TaxID=598644 RepID=A0A4R6SC50_LABRH|nr:hypothetical protein [Labedaea rhizosphaerae]TDP97639.1 hypothetical protein EV186_103603 [Labedaea rhizosphaerae]
MGAVLDGLAQSAPQLGVGGIVLFLFARLLRRESVSDQRHTVELTSVHARREAAEARGDRLQERLDEEMERRRALEDELAQCRRGGRS